MLKSISLYRGPSQVYRVCVRARACIRVIVALGSLCFTVLGIPVLKSISLYKDSSFRVCARACSKFKYGPLKFIRFSLKS